MRVLHKLVCMQKCETVARERAQWGAKSRLPTCQLSNGRADEPAEICI